MAQVRVVVNPRGIEMLRASPQVRAVMGRWAALAVQRMKVHTPVSPSAYPQWPGGYHRPGDYPLSPSGRLRRSVGAFAQPDGDILVGPTVSYARYVNDGTPAHLIRSRGRWPLRSPATGQVFGPLVHHPGTRGAHFIEKTARDIDGKEYHV